MNATPLIAGVDEAGRGPLAGPVVVAAAVLDPEQPIAGLRDSKKLSEAQRTHLDDQIRRRAKDFTVVVIDVATIDQINILQATLLGMRRAVQGLSRTPSLALIDGNKVPPRMPCESRALVGGDDLEDAISAASILAKVARDRLMEELDGQFPGYGFARHRGYATVQHREALNRLGPCPAHRRSFAPVAALLEQDLFSTGLSGPSA